MTTWQPQDRIEAMSWLLIACFASVLLLSSQSGASFLTYVLGITVIVSVRQWADVRASALFWLVSVTLAYFAMSVFWSEPFSWRAVLSNFVRALLIFCFVVAFAEVQLRGIIGLWLRRGFVAVGLIAILAAAVVFVATDPPDGRLNGLGQLDTHVIAALVFGVVVVCALQVLLRDAGVWKGLALVTVVSGRYGDCAVRFA